MSSCTNPLLAVRLYKDNLGKSSIKILPRTRIFTIEELNSKYGSDNVLELPCGHCLACISNKRKEWAVRCCLEAQDHKENCFLTLTYDPNFYDDQFHRDHIKKFFKKLYNLGYKFRYFGCGERGDEEGRCHYHILMFGFWPQDARFYSKTKSGGYQYTSELLSSCWSFGFLTVSEFSPAAASYVAGYVFKKINIEDDSFHFQSTRPGIGQAYVLKNIQNLYETDNLILSFGSHVLSIPRYFDKVAVECFNMDLDDIKNKRLSLASKKGAKELRDLGLEYRPELLKYQDEVSRQQFKLKRRMF